MSTQKFGSQPSFSLVLMLQDTSKPMLHGGSSGWLEQERSEPAPDKP
jgi:hypothetical protein